MRAILTMSRNSSGARHSAVPVLVVLALCLGGCFTASAPPRKVNLPEPSKDAQLAPAIQREHQRILGAYNGAYHEPRVEALVKQTVDRLVAASDRPEQHYRITVLNSPSVNAFALPSGQLYMTRGLIALANDSSELASVLAHE